jgi:hypothetical protein
MPDRLGALPVELLYNVSENLTPQERVPLAGADRRMHSVFHQSNLHAKFLECVAYGQQDKAKKLLREVFAGQPARIQAVLLHQGTFTDYSGRTFICSAYEYAYWAKDTHMCRMLERYMDDATKAEMLARVTEIERTRLSYTQHGVACCTHHFDLTPLIQSLKFYVDNYDAWSAAGNWDVMEAAWLNVGLAQRDVPAHVAQEYCRPDRDFNPCPTFNEPALPRILTFENRITSRDKSWFPLTSSNSGLGFDFTLIQHWGTTIALRRPGGKPWVDLAAVSRLDKVRTFELTQSREHLNPPPMSQSMSV